MHGDDVSRGQAAQLPVDGVRDDCRENRKMQQRRKPHRSTVNAIADAADQRACEKGRGDIAEVLLGKSETFGHVHIKHRTPDRIEAPQCQQRADREEQRLAKHAEQRGPGLAQARRIEMGVFMVARVAPCHGESEQPQHPAESKGERLEPLLGDIASEDPRQQQSGVRCGPLDGLKAPGQPEGLPFLDHERIDDHIAQGNGHRSRQQKREQQPATSWRERDECEQEQARAARPLARSR